MSREGKENWVGRKEDKIMPERGFIILVLFFLTIPVYASVDFKADYFNEPREIAPYRFQGSKDNNGDGKPDEMYYKEGNKELLIEDTDYDGKVNRVGYTENGVLIKMEQDIEYSWGTVKSISSSVSRWFGGKTKPSEIQQYHIEKFLNGKLGKVRR